MVEPLILESFVTAVACLCASSYGPNIRPKTNLRANIATALTDWDRNVLQIFLNSNRKFSFNDSPADCQLLDSDNLDERLHDLEFEARKQKQQSSKLSEELKRLSDNCKDPNKVLLEADKAELTEVKKKLNAINQQVEAFQLAVKAKNEEVEKLKVQHEKDQNELKELRDELINIKEQTAKPKNGCSLTERHGVSKIDICIKEFIFCAKDLPAKFGNGWMLVAQRFDGSQHFYFDWLNYAEGFGRHSANFEFFVGLDRLHTLTRTTPYELLFILKDIYNQTRYAHYDRFIIGNSARNYELISLGKFTGDAGDSLNYHLKQKFATFDKDNESQCAEKHTGAWWYKNGDCHRSNLFGLHKTRRPKSDYHKLNGMIWSTFHNTDDGNLASMRMYLRPKENA